MQGGAEGYRREIDSGIERQRVQSCWGETVEFKSNSILFLQPLHLREASRTYQKASFLWWAVNLLSGALRPPVKPQPSTA